MTETKEHIGNGFLLARAFPLQSRGGPYIFGTNPAFAV